MKHLLCLITSSLIIYCNTSSAQNNLCNQANPFCSNQGAVTFPAGVNAGTAQTGPNYGCLYSEPNPAWYYMQVGNSGDIDIEMHSTPQVDIDFACWGPFTSQTAPCVGQLTAGSGLSSHTSPGPSPMYPSLNMIDCSYSTSWQEFCYIPNGISGQYYILMITNYSNQPCNINFSQTGGTGSTNCGILAPPVTGDTVCVGQTINLHVNSPTSGATYAWTGPNGFSSNTMNPTIPNATTAMTGTYSLVITIGAQVSPPVTCSVTVNPNPVVSITPANPSVCSGAPVTLNPNSTIPLTWFTWSTGVQGTSGITVSPTTPTSYLLNGADQNGCTGTASVTVNINPDLVLSVTPTSPLICIGASVNLTAYGADTYIWSPSATLSADSGTVVSASPVVNTTYTVTGTNLAGCTGTTTITVATATGPAINIQANPDHICPGDSSTLTVVGSANNFVWSPAFSLSVSTGPVTVAHPVATTTYSVQGDNNGCISTTSFTLVVSPIPNVDFTSDLNEGCVPMLVHFQDLTTPPVNTWNWSFGDNPLQSDFSNLQNPTRYFENTGSYDVTLSVITVDGCSMSMTYPDYIKVHPIPISDFAVNPKNVNELDPLVFFEDQSVGASVWNWTFGDNFSTNNNSSAQNPNHVYSDTGTFIPRLIVFSDFGCSDTSARQVIVEPNVAFYIPNAFSPNGDGKNNTFKPYGEGVDLNSFEMRIYDRWGEQVCFTRDMEKGWDGKINGNKQAEQGIYNWIISYYDVKLNQHVLKGTVLLLK